MLKVILSVFGSVFITTSALVIFFWRDSKYEPSAMDLVVFLVGIPLAISFVLLLPYIGIKWHKHRKEKLSTENKGDASQADVQQLSTEDVLNPEWVKLNIYSSAIEAALGKDEDLLRSIIDLKGPELDNELTDATGNPLLSYRITSLSFDEMDTLGIDTSEGSVTNRTLALIYGQLETHTINLMAVAEHLKQSALFYESSLAYEYKMHPAWYDPNAEVDESEFGLNRSIEPVTKLTQMNVILFLSEQLLHQWDEQQSSEVLHEYFDRFGILKQNIKFKYIYSSKLNSFDIYLRELQNASMQEDQINLFIVADSEISQDIIDEKIWVKPNYIASEFCSSCLLASKIVNIQNVDPIKQLDFVYNQPKLSEALAHLEIDKSLQCEKDEAFVSILGNPKESKVVKNLQSNFVESGIENQHFYYSKSSLGDSDELASLFGFMLALHMNDQPLSMVYSTEHPSIQVFIQNVNEDE